MTDPDLPRRLEELKREVDILRRELAELRTHLSALLGVSGLRTTPSGRTQRSPEMHLAALRAGAARARAAKRVGSGKGAVSATAKRRLESEIHVLQAQIDTLLGELEEEK